MLGGTEILRQAERPDFGESLDLRLEAEDLENEETSTSLIRSQEASEAENERSIILNSSDVSSNAFSQDEFNDYDKKKYTAIKYMLTNARSLSPKIISLVQCFEEMALDVAIITESWLASGTELEEDLSELEYGTDLSLIYKNRPVRPSSRRRTAGGGVAIIFNKNRCKFKEKRIRSSKYEIVCAVGRIQGVERRIMVLGLH